MKFKNIKEAKKDLVEAILKEYIGTLTDNDKLQENSIKKAYKIDNYIKGNFDLKEMKDLLNHDIPKVQIWIANMLLPIYEEAAIKLLDDISKRNIPHCSYNAEMMLFNWKRKKNA
ncbi:hypothetical protein MHTCC0001_35790 [Flavobacteriaceae bacterium MHTCC 0001]